MLERPVSVWFFLLVYVFLLWVWFWPFFYYRLVILMSRRCPWSLISISFTCSSLMGVCTFPACASWISWISSALANSGLTIFRLFRRCLASGVSIRRSMACFWVSICCCCCALCCSWASLCCSSCILRRRIPSSSPSSSSSSLNCCLHQFFLRVLF